MTEPTLPSTVRHIFDSAKGGRKFHHFSALFRVDGIQAGLVHPAGLRFISKVRTAEVAASGSRRLKGEQVRITQ